MSNLTLVAKSRPKTGKGSLLRMRKEGRIPAIVYGLEKEPQLVEINAIDMRGFVGKKNNVIDMNIDGAVQQVMLKVIETDPIRRDLFIHIDFLRVNNERPVIVNVPVSTFGIPFGVKTQGGVFSVMKKFVKLRAKIQDIPEKFDMDITDLQSGTIFYVKDLKFEKGTFVTPGKTALYGVTTGGKVEEEVVAEKPAAAAPAAGKDGKAPAAAGKDAKAPAGGKDKK
jgi:large subunit ribosomal protein L25